ncbi:unnamed protein product [Pseudo-nitzschia multistriata]|uniref:SAM-dependent MTase RsmB/NOP-type domain-containing protein n=1 Tax=Pseudo-nitzschia multistriata TaxID=183589 RepID=A0A448YWY9_9STRA|nr:unnamed protein product [Pseudo-nitzschia multistriata]
MSTNGGPFICSLQSLEIHLNDEIRQHLSDQYSSHLTIDDGNHTEEKTQKESRDCSLGAIFSAMKRPPAFTTCRVNLIRSSREEVLSELQNLLSHIPQLEVVEDAGFSDIINIVPKAQDDCDSQSKNPDDKGYQKTTLSNSTGPDDHENDEGGGRTNAKGEAETSNSMFHHWQSRKEQGWSMNYRSVVCDRFCGEAVLRGSDIFVKGILAADTNIQAGEKVAVYADIPQKIESQKVLRGMKLDQYRGRCVYLGLGRAECSRNEIFSKAQGVGIIMSLDPKDRVGPPLPPLYGVLPNKMMLQNLPSVLVGHALNPRPNDVILDMCSAPGGKASHLASLVRNQALIVACDKSKKKVMAAKELFARMGASCIIPLALDATNCCIGNVGNVGDKNVQQIIAEGQVGKEGLKEIKKFYEKSFDKILLDPPCSALGLRPKLFIAQETLKELQKHAEYQRKFVEQAVKLLKVGGYMTYSTCTINGDENEGMVSHILRAHPCMELMPIELPNAWRQKNIGRRGLNGFGLSTNELDCVRRFEPNGTADTMGFFVALFRKRF